MTVRDATIEKLRQLPDRLVKEVSDFVDFLLVRSDSDRWQQWTTFSEALDLGEGDFSDYLANLEEYEDRLAAGEIQW